MRGRAALVQTAALLSARAPPPVEGTGGKKGSARKATARACNKAGIALLFGLAGVWPCLPFTATLPHPTPHRAITSHVQAPRELLRAFTCHNFLPCHCCFFEIIPVGSVQAFLAFLRTSHPTHIGIQADFFLHRRFCISYRKVGSLSVSYLY